MHDSSPKAKHDRWKREAASGLRVAGLMLLFFAAVYFLVDGAVDLRLIPTDGPNLNLFPANPISAIAELILGVTVLVLIARHWMKAISGLTLLAVFKSFISAATGHMYLSSKPIEPMIALAYGLYFAVIAALSWRFMFSKPSTVDKAAGAVLVLSFLFGMAKPAYLAPGLAAMLVAWLWSKRLEHKHRTHVHEAGGPS